MADAGKNRRRQLEAWDSVHGRTLSVDSKEEQDFINWLCEANSLSVIGDFQYQPPSFGLFGNTKYVDVDGKTKTLFQDHVYSCDFVVEFDAEAQKGLARELKVGKDQLSAGPVVSAYIDTKGLFNRNGRSFSTDRKWVWEKYGVYVAEVVPVKWFAKFGCPKASFLSEKTKKARKAFIGMKSVRQAFGLEDRRGENVNKN